MYPATVFVYARRDTPKTEINAKEEDGQKKFEGIVVSGQRNKQKREYYGEGSDEIHTERHTYRKTCIQIDIHAERHTCRMTYMQKDIQKDTHTE